MKNNAQLDIQALGFYIWWQDEFDPLCHYFKEYLS
jgi:hypothetical protein